MKLFINTIVILYIELLFNFFPFIISLIYKRHKKIRSIVYAYWLKYDTSRFNLLLDAKFLNINFNHIYILDGLVYVGKNNQIPICYEKDFLYNKKIEKYRYYFYYIFGYMFLDDVDNFEGVNKKVMLNPKYLKEIIKNNYNKYRVIQSIYSEVYWKDSYDVPCSVISFFIKNSYSYNYLRDKAWSRKKEGFKYLGYEYDVKTYKYLFAMNRVKYLRRQNG